MDDGEKLNESEIWNHEPELDVEPQQYYDSEGNLIIQPQRYGMRKRRTVAEREGDLVVEARLWLEGNTLEKVAQKLCANRDYTLSHVTIHNDIQEILRRWKSSYLVDANEKVAIELEKINNLESEYWEAWRRSCEATQSVETQKVEFKPDEEGQINEDIDDEGQVRGRKKKGVRVRQTVIQEQHIGDNKFLQGVERCILMRMRILGIGQAKTVNINWKKQAIEAGVDNPEEVVNGLVEQFVAAAALGAGSSGRSME